MKTNIDYFTDFQNEAKNESNKIKKQNSNLRNSAIFGKSVKNVKNQIDIKNLTTRKQYLKGSFRSALKDKNDFVIEP